MDEYNFSSYDAELARNFAAVGSSVSLFTGLMKEVEDAKNDPVELKRIAEATRVSMPGTPLAEKTATFMPWSPANLTTSFLNEVDANRRNPGAIQSLVNRTRAYTDKLHVEPTPATLGVAEAKAAAAKAVIARAATERAKRTAEGEKLAAERAVSGRAIADPDERDALARTELDRRDL